uniref:WRKY19-like zinc finger domain-containing protein n=1 Tax=Globisporangium ultimum (strain ATCC 200006 / CBS 805.95 / DAOM BR144) TaxID=431595 RepID=K3XBV2_GLOUD
MFKLERMPQLDVPHTQQQPADTVPMLPGVHSYLMSQGHRGSMPLPRLTPSLPSLPSVLGSRTNQLNARSTGSPSQGSSSILFLLNPTEDAQRAQVAPAPMSIPIQSRVRPRPVLGLTASRHMSNSGHESASSGVEESLLPQGQLKKKRKARICKADGCEKYVVDRGLCIRHGGGKRCSVDDCNCRAQNRGLCWKHGGYTRCTVEGCTKRAKSRGICWSHGGGTRCKHGGCSKIAVSHGLCWAHGGGKRCLIESCQKPAYERNGNLCAEHCDSTTNYQESPL